jgi:hypothetical protein
LATQTGVHAFIEWCGVMTEHIKIMECALSKGVQPDDLDQHKGASFDAPGFMVAYLCEKLGCQLKPLIHADKKTWKREIDKWFKD